MQDKELEAEAIAAFELHVAPRPWVHNTLQVADANGRQVFYLGGQNSSDRRRADGFWLTGLAAFIVKCVNFPPAVAKRRLNSMFHIDGAQRLVKTTNDQPVPEDEPLFILRGRDALAADAIRHYIVLQLSSGVPADRITGCMESLGEFDKFKLEHADRMKQPGITHGK